MKLDSVSYRQRLLLLLFLSTSFRFVYINLMELAPDEAYYWDISRRFQLSYYDHPPMLMYLLNLSTKVLGNTEFAVRLPSVLTGAAVTLLTYHIGKEMFDDRVGFYSALLVNITPIYAVGGVLATIDTPFALFWLLALYFGVRAIKTGEGKWWYLKDISLGFGMLSKYIMILFVPVFLMFLLLSKEHRHWLKRKEPYIGGLIALLIFMPVIIWNAENEWASFRFQLSHGLEIKKRAGLPSLIEYIGSQAGVVSPFLFLACLWSTAKGLILWGRDRNWRYLFLTSASSLIILFFGYSSLRASVEGNWAMAAYFTAIILLVHLYFTGACRRKKVITGIVLGTSFMVTLIAHIQAVAPVISTQKDITDQMHGWSELGLEVGAVLNELKQEGHPDIPTGFFIMADSYRLTGELSFYIPSNPYVYELAGDGKFNQYNMWEGPGPGSDALLVGDPEEEVSPYVRSLFADVKEVRQVKLLRGKKVVREYSIYICRKFRGFGSPGRRLNAHIPL